MTRLGRRSEALEVYGRLLIVLREELGIDPSQGFRRLHMQILNGSEHDLEVPGWRLAE
ncbi:BTAD domain-containing putative transcriptional regulator [Tsukamurella pulmonis]|uniref:BTAD domain-containing putative transcriptional regulator n=1 Tax=Tsukamurella pulmonis TaxID=47312 RepID=UPI0009EB9BAB